jgi:HEPN domain-containing protein
MMAVIEVAGKKSTYTLRWLAWADEDYIAARTLLLDGLVVQGAALANTAVEKYLKGVCELRNISFRGAGHDVSKLNGLLHRNGVTLGLNLDFLEFLNKAYQLRYPDDLVPGFNMALNSAATLVETDLTVKRIRKGFTFKQDGEPVQTRFDILLREGAAPLVAKNCAIDCAARENLFSGPSWSYEIRVLQNDVVLQARYQTEVLRETNHFRCAGLASASEPESKRVNFTWPPTGGGKGVDFSAPPEREET